MRGPRVKESIVQRQIVKALTLLGYLVIHIPNQATRGRQRYSGLLSGAPDLVVIGDGKVWFMEVKSAGRGQSEAQKVVQQRIEARGFTYAVVRSVDDALKVVGHGS